MLEKVEVRTDQGVLLILSMEDPTNGLLVDDIEGLGPVKANLVSSSFAQIDGVQYQSSRREARNLVFNVVFRPEYTGESVRQIRKRLYNFFMPKSNVNLKFFVNDLYEGMTVNILGKVETNVPVFFDEEPGAQISVMCFRPDFVDDVVNTLSSMTTFLGTEQTIEYDGEIDSGILFNLMVDRDISDFTIYHTPPDGLARQLTFAVTEPLIAGDVLSISTLQGNKFASLMRGGSSSPILYGMSPYSDWTTLRPGTNKIRVYAEGPAIPYEIIYTNKYGGL